MKFTCTRNDLRNALQAVYKAVPNKAQTPIISGIYLRAESSVLELQSNNFSLGIRARIPSSTEDNGEVVVIGKYLVDMIGKCVGEVVTFSVEDDDNMLHIRSGGTEFTLLMMNVDDFPKVEAKDVINSFGIKPRVLKDLITRATFSCSNDAERPMFTGCCVDIVGDSITFAATNAHRLSIVRGKVLNNLETLNMIIPASTLNILKGMLNDSESDSTVNVQCSDKNVAFTFDNLFLTSRLIDGQYPPYEKVIPKETYTTAVAKVADFRAAVSRVELISKASENFAIRFIFEEGSPIRISASSYDVGTAEEYVDAQIEGPPLDITFNVNYITDFIKVMESEEFKMAMDKPLAPIDVREVGSDDFIYIVTPLRTKR